MEGVGGAREAAYGGVAGVRVVEPYDPGMGIEDLLGGRDLGDVKKAVGFVIENSDDFQRCSPGARSAG